MRYVATIGLEIHTQLKTRSKLFCPCSTAVVDEPNVHVCPICLGYPGILPRLNRSAVEQGVRTVKALGMRIADTLRFDRKHYIYADLAKSFQTSQFASTLGRGGTIDLEVRGKAVSIRLREAHLEEDAAKLDHTPYESKVDFNRAGTPLLEVVTEPDLHIGEEAEALLRHLALLLRTIGASDASAELGQLRCDVNISVAGEERALGTRVEIKNLNSPRFVRLAIEAEFERQVKLLESGRPVLHETRSWNENRGVTESMRSKEMAHDYRYLSEPDLPAVTLTAEDIERITADMPDLPEERAKRFARDFGVSLPIGRELVSEPAIADYFEETVGLLGSGDLAASWILNQVREIENRQERPYSPPLISPVRLAELLRLVRDDRLSYRNAKRILDQVAASDESPTDVLESLGLEQISDRSLIRAWVTEVVADHQNVVEALGRGKTQSFQFLVGQVIRRQRNANPRLVREELQAALDVRRIALIDMGGAITAERDGDGAMRPASAEVLEHLIDAVCKSRQDARVEHIPVTRELSENLTPQEWYRLWAALHDIVRGDSHQGVVVTHGLDTLAYTASLMRWLLPAATMPVVFTGSTRAPRDESSDARDNLAAAIDFVRREKPGFWVSMGNRNYPATNLRMTSTTVPVFTSFNLGDPDEHGNGAAVPGLWTEPVPDLEALEDAVARTLLLKVYPGLEPDWIAPVLDEGVRYVLLELFDTGTANARWDVRQSLLPLVRTVNRLGGIVFCTSQLGVPVNLAEFGSSQDLWGAGVVPLGRLVTESALTKLIAAQLMSSERKVIVRLMTAEEFSL